jgi:hypothetical protein
VRSRRQSRLAGNPAAYDPPVEAVGQIERCRVACWRRPIATVSPGSSTCHALDHLTELRRLGAPRHAADWQPPAGFEERPGLGVARRDPRPEARADAGV